MTKSMLCKIRTIWNLEWCPKSLNPIHSPKRMSNRPPAFPLPQEVTSNKNKIWFLKNIISPELSLNLLFKRRMYWKPFYISISLGKCEGRAALLWGTLQVLGSRWTEEWTPSKIASKRYACVSRDQPINVFAPFVCSSWIDLNLHPRPMPLLSPLISIQWIPCMPPSPPCSSSRNNYAKKPTTVCLSASIPVIFRTSNKRINIPPICIFILFKQCHPVGLMTNSLLLSRNQSSLLPLDMQFNL